MTARAWRERARCRQADPALFFSPEGERPAERVLRELAAHRVCRACPVTADCLAWALETGDRHAYLGDTAAADRKDMRRPKRAREQRPVPAGEREAG